MCYTLSRRRRARGDSGGGELHLIEVSEVVRQPERPHEQRLDRVRLLALVVDGVLEAVAVLPYYRLAPPSNLHKMMSAVWYCNVPYSLSSQRWPKIASARSFLKFDRGVG